MNAPREDILEVDVEIPVGLIQSGQDADGLIRTDPVTTEEPAPDPKETELETLRRERDAKANEAETHRRSAAEAAARLAEESTRRTGAEKERDERTAQALRAHHAAVHSEHQQIVSAISGWTIELDAAEAAMRAAREAGDVDQEIKAQRRLAAATQNLATLEQGRPHAEAAAREAAAAVEALVTARPEPTPKKDEPAAKPEPKQQTPEEWIAGCPDATHDWLKSHKDYVTDTKLNRKLLRFAEEYAEDHGGMGALDTSDFVKALDAKFFPTQQDKPVTPDKDDGQDVDVTPAAAARSTPAAPVSRSASPTANTNAQVMNRKVRLTADEQATALQMYPDMNKADAIKQYANNKAKAIAEGLYR
jgi:hypothetical protein